MKNKIIRILIFLFCIFLITIYLIGCSANIKSNVETNKKLPLNENPKVEIPTLSSEITNNKSSEIQYKETKVDNITNKKTEIYTDEQGSQYIFGSDDGELKGFYKGGNFTSSTTSQSESKEELKNLADSFLKDYIELNTYFFTGHVYNDDTKIHTFNYCRKIKDYNSADFAFVMISEHGDVIGYAAPNINIFDNVVIPEINDDKMIKDLEEKMKQKYKYSKYEINQKTLILNSEKRCGMLIRVTVVVDNTEQGDEFIISL